MEGIIISIFICVVLPVSVVLITSLARINADNKRAQIIIKAIEANNNIDADKLAASLENPRKSKSSKEILHRRLLVGCVLSFLGIAAAGVGIMSVKVLVEDGLATLSFFCSAVCLAIGLGYLVTYFVTRKDS